VRAKKDFRNRDAIVRKHLNHPTVQGGEIIKSKITSSYPALVCHNNKKKTFFLKGAAQLKDKGGEHKGIAFVNVPAIDIDYSVSV